MLSSSARSLKDIPPEVEVAACRRRALVLLTGGNTSHSFFRASGRFCKDSGTLRHGLEQDVRE